MRYFAAIAFLAAALAACQPSSAEPSIMTPEQGSEAGSEAPTADLAASTEESAAPAQATTEPPAAVPPVRQELAATDPSSVNLASGKPTLVEFFAFW